MREYFVSQYTTQHEISCYPIYITSTCSSCMISQEIANKDSVPKSHLFNPVYSSGFRHIQMRKHDITLYVFVRNGTNNFQTHPFNCLFLLAQVIAYSEFVAVCLSNRMMNLALIMFLYTIHII